LPHFGGPPDDGQAGAGEEALDQIPTSRGVNVNIVEGDQLELGLSAGGGNER
jgi:hypothetical protein